MVRIYTKHGDTGETGLLYGGRVSKTDPRTTAYGTVDEAISTLGLARALSDDAWIKSEIKRIQRELFTVGAELATDVAEYAKLEKHFSVVTSDMVDRLEGILDDLETKLDLPPSFIIPGASPASAAMDVARTVVRRAERHTVTLKEKSLLMNQEVLRYLNRLADLLFMLARYQDRNLPLEKVGE